MITNVDAVTVFNGRMDKETRRTKYIPTLIRGVSYVEAKGATVTNNGVWSDNVQYKIRVPLIAIVQDDRQYIPALKYSQLDDDGAVNHWTINKGDLVIKGEYTGDIPLYEDALTAYAKEQGLNLIHVTEYADDTDGGSLYTKHWRIGGK